MKNGMNLNKCLIYCRVSTPDQAHNGNGIDSQEQICRKWARHEDLTVERVFIDAGISGSATENRTQLQVMLDFLSKTKDRYLILFYNIERLSRNAGDFNTLRDLIETKGHWLATVQGVLEQTPVGRFMATIQAAQGQYWRESNAELNKRFMQERARQGYWVFQEPWGYEFQRVGSVKELVLKEPDASIIREALTGYASGRFSTIPEVRAHINNHRPKLGLKPYNLTQTKELLSSPKYTGFFAYEKWNIPPQKWHIEPLIDMATHKLIQDRLNNRVRASKHTRYNKDDPDFPLRGYVSCPTCGYALTGSHSTNRIGNKYPYYQCHNKKCAGRRGMYINANRMHEDFEQLLERIAPGVNYMGLARALAHDVYNEHEARYNAEWNAKQKRIEQIEQECQQMFKAFTQATTDAMRQMCEQRINDLRTEQHALTHELNAPRAELMPFDRAFEYVAALAGNPLEVWRNSDLKFKRCVLDIYFQGHFSYDKEQKFGTPKIAPIFKWLRDFSGDKSKMVPVVGLEPTTY